MPSLRSLLLATVVISHYVTWITSRHHFTHNVSNEQNRHKRRSVNFSIPDVLNKDSEAWGEWGEVSSCSRTCGGGLASQKRECLEIGNGKPMCMGNDIKILSCQTQECPEGSADAIAKQCAQAHPILFEENIYHSSRSPPKRKPCEQACTLSGDRFHYIKAPDGMRCNDQPFDVCVDGVCQPVGCDMVLGSDAREDKCRQCRGKGANCHTISGVLNMQNVEKGYLDVLLIPQGATNILITEQRASNNYLALRAKEENVYYLNGDYLIALPQSMVIAGAVWQYERSQGGSNTPDKLRCLGPINEPLYLSILLQELDADIHYEYSIPFDQPTHLSTSETSSSNHPITTESILSSYSETENSITTEKNIEEVTETEISTITARETIESPGFNKSKIPRNINNCIDTDLGCIHDSEANTSTPNGAETVCGTTKFGCCPDGESTAKGTNMKGYVISCNISAYGCCPDGETSAHGPESEGCCLESAFGCCPDNYRPADGPHLEGCGCENSHFGCCPDNITIARGANKEGCGCKYSNHGCCPDKHTEAQGPAFEGCGCHTYQLGCCPDGVTVAQIPDIRNCFCEHSEYGCCGDRITAAKGPNLKGCDCSNSKYGCCPDGETEAKGKGFLGCNIPDTSDPCTMEINRGPCAGIFQRWGFNRELQRCVQFTWGGCKGNQNSFSSEAACLLRCDPPGVPKQACSLPKEAGNCTEKHPAWSFSATENRCVPFYYTGCGGNDNRFNDEQTCTNACPSAYEPLVISKETQTEVTASEGSKATLRCLSHGNPEPRVIWHRNGTTDTIESDMEHYQILPDGALEIMSSYRNDSGVYICKADNGLEKEIRLEVAVSKKPEVKWVKVSLDGVINLDCEGNGHRIKWIKDGKRLDRTKYVIIKYWTLIVKKAKYSDSGVYVCSVEPHNNEFINTTFIVMVGDSSGRQKYLYNRTLDLQHINKR